MICDMSFSINSGVKYRMGSESQTSEVLETSEV